MGERKSDERKSVERKPILHTVTRRAKLAFSGVRPLCAE
jgi:hypothetical protein